MIPDPRFNHLREELRSHLLAVSADQAASMAYYKRRWDEDRGDDYAAWGCSDWFFEAAPDGTVTRHMENYDDGTVLQYHANHIEDVFGFLTDQPLDHAEYRPFAISRDEFEAAWASHPPSNQQ
jgi:hypothetical protein